MYVGKFMKSLVIGRVSDTATATDSSLQSKKTVCFHFVVAIYNDDIII